MRIFKGVFSFIEKEIRLAEGEIADLREKYDVSKKRSYMRGWEDYITWENKERYIEELKEIKSFT